MIALRDEKNKRALLTIAPFADIGTVWNNSDNSTLIASNSFLAAGGLGVIIEPFEQLILRIDTAIPFIKLQDRGSNLQDASVYFNAIFRF